MPVSAAIWLPLLLIVSGCSGTSPAPSDENAVPAANATGATEPQTYEEAVAALQPSPNAIQATVVDVDDLTPAEQMYGLAPQPHPSIRYQDDVVIVAGGANSIRSMSGDGLLWVLDATAPGTKELAVGKVAFVTGRCVGRVLHIDRQGDTLRMLLGPVELTEIYRRLELVVSQPLNLERSVDLPAPQSDLVAFPLDGDEIPLPPSGVDIHRLIGSTMPPSFWRDGGQFIPVQVSPGIPQRLNVQFQTTRPLIDGHGFGAEMKHEGKGTRIAAQAQLQVTVPELYVHIVVTDGGLHAIIAVKNTAGLLLAFDAAAGDDFSRNVNWHLPLGGVSFPLAPPVPFSADFRHSLNVQTVFSGKNAYFSTRGEYKLKGDLGVVYFRKRFYPKTPTFESTTSSVFDNMSGASIGPNGIVIDHTINIVAGVGAAGFTAGPSLQILTSLGAARGADIGIVRCAGATLAMKLRGGIGWTIPAGLAYVVNAVLSLFRVKPIPDHGGPYFEWVEAFKPKTAGGEGGMCSDGAGA